LERNIQAVAVLSRYKDLSKALVGKVQSVLVKYRVALFSTASHVGPVAQHALEASGFQRCKMASEGSEWSKPSWCFEVKGNCRFVLGLFVLGI
jgi:hypothetical protein